MRMLIADDSQLLRLYIVAALEPLGHEILEAATGPEALAVLTGPHPPALAILDWIMPDLDGPEVCQRVRQTPLAFQPYLILMSQKDAKEDVIHGLGMGANDYVSKPFHEGELRARVEVGERVVRLERTLRDRIQALEAATAHVRALQGILPICMYCHRIRNDQESWQRLESYITEHSEATLSHGLCPDCAPRMLE